MENNTIINVKNRSTSRVIYRIPEDGIRREFAPGESKRIRWEELEKLSYQVGGMALLRDFLQLTNSDVIEELAMRVEPEYNMSEHQIVALIQSGSLDAFLDCLDFAPTGVIDLLKKFAVSLPLTDYNKRIALKEKTGFDVDAALKNLEAERQEEQRESRPSERRVVQNAITEETPISTPVRRTSGSKYKVVSQE